MVALSLTLLAVLYALGGADALGWAAVIGGLFIVVSWGLGRWVDSLPIEDDL